MVSFKNNLSLFLSDSITYVIVNLINKVVPFFLLPLLTSLLSLSDFGRYSFFIVIESSLIPLVTLNLMSAISSHYYTDKFVLQDYISTIIISIMSISLSIILFFQFIPTSFFEKLAVSRHTLTFATLIASISGILTMVSNLFRMQRLRFAYGTLTIAQTVVLFLLLYISIIYKPVYSNLIYSRVFSFVFIFICLLSFLSYKNYISLVFDQKILKWAFKFSWPTILYSLSALVFLSSDRYFITGILGPEKLAIYTAVFQITSILSVFNMSINAAWMPWLFENLRKKCIDIDLFIVKLSYLFFVILITIGLIMITIVPYLINLFLPNNYVEYNYIATPMIIGFIFEAIYLIVSPYVFFVAKTKYNAIVGIVVAIINVFLNLFLIPRLGILGASIATCSSWFLLAVSFFFFSYRVYPMPWLFFLKKS